MQPHGEAGFHVFVRNGERFVYIPSARRFYCIDELAYTLLMLCRTRPLQEARAALIADNAHSAAAIDEVCAEIEWLESEGLFAPQEPAWTDEWVEKAVEQRVKSGFTRLQLALTESCNLACKYCYNGTCRDIERQGTMPLETAQTALDWLIDVSGNEKAIRLTLFGGEPLLNQTVFRYLMDDGFEHARQRGKELNFSMTTNGTLMSDEVIHDIKRRRFGLLVSMDGPPEVHDRQRPYRHGGGSTHDVAARVRKLRQERSRISVRCTLTKEVPRLLDLIEYFEELGFTRIGFAPALNPMAPTVFDCDPTAFEEIHRQQDEELLSWMFERLEAGKLPVHFPYASFITEHGVMPNLRGRRLSCGVTRGQTTMGADGALYPCHRFLGMSQFRLGHISDGPNLDHHAWLSR